MIFYFEAAALAFTLAVNLTILGFPIAFVIFAAFKLTRFASPRLRYIISLAALLLAALLPTFATFNTVREHRLTSAISANVSENEEKTKGASKQNTDASFIHTSDFITVTPDTTPVQAVGVVDSFVNLATRTSLAVIFLTIWMSVGAILLCREISGHLYLLRRRKTWRLADKALLTKLNWSRKIPLYIAEHEGPCAVGFFRRAMVIPENLFDNLSLNEMHYVAQHELAHVKWRDPLVNSLLRIIRAVFWVSLPIWYLERVVRLEREAAADCEAILFSSSSSSNINAIAAEYASALITIAKQSAMQTKTWHSAAATTEINVQSNLENRINRLLAISSQPSRVRLFLAAVIIFAGIAGLIVIPIASQPLDSLITKNDENKDLLNLQTSLNADADTSGSNISITNAIEAIFNKAVTFNKETNPPEAERENKIKERITLAITEALPQENNFLATESPPHMLGYTVIPTPPVPIATPIVRSDLTEEQINQMQKYGVSPAYIEEMAALGYKNLSIDRLIDMKRLALSGSFIREMAAEGYENLSLELLLDYRRHAVNPAYIREMRSHGYDKLSPQMLDDFKGHGVSSAYIEEMASFGYRNLPARTILDFRKQSVNSAFIKEMRESVSGSISASELVDLKFHGVSQKFIDELSALGFAKLTANQLISMKIHGVTTAFVEKMKARGGSKNYSANDLISMRMNGER
jgi:beta-lactamase regulating signal transducer with metallopeptidase domain